MNTSVQTIQDTLSSAKRVALFGHERPDGDSIGSVLGLYHLLTSNTSAKVTPHTLDDVPENLAFLP